jgi:ectoine hydroxylase-related dioxygenase (phytanoyl-CoA dioxygenase family)
MTSDGKEWVAKLDDEGFAIVPDVVNLNTVASLIQVIAGAGHALRNLHTEFPAVKVLAQSNSIRGLVETILGPKAFVARSLLFDKTPSANWKVAWHQDLTIAVQQPAEVEGYGPWSIKAGIPHVQPPAEVLEKMLTVRLHLDDCTECNGPLRVIPGSHRNGKLTATEIERMRAHRDAKDCIVARGGILLMRPLLLHASSTARQPGHRRVIHLEFAAQELDGGLDWHN